MDANPNTNTSGPNSSGAGQTTETTAVLESGDDSVRSIQETAGRLRNWLATGVFALAFLIALAAVVIIGYSALSGQALWNTNNIIISLVVISGLFGIYPLTYLAYLGQRGASDRERLIDDFGLLGLEDKDKIEQTVQSLYRTVFNPAQYLIFIVLILLISVIVVLAYLSRNAIDFLNERALELAFFAFLGAYVFSVQELIRRFNTKDLLPQVYSSILGRMILSVTLVFVGAVIIDLGAANLAEGSADSTIPAWGAIVAFVIGIFPKRGMNWFSRRTEGVLQTAGRTQDERPLEHIIGISPLHASRLNEMGIDDAQNLATADLRRLLLTTQFDTQQVVGWIDQAILYAKVGDLLDRFRDAKIGTFHELHTLVIDLDLLVDRATSEANGTPAANSTQQLLPLLGLGSLDQLRWLANYGNYPNYAHIAEYYYRKGKVARQRAKLGMEGILGAQGNLLVGTIIPMDPRDIGRAEREEYESRLRDLKRVLSHDQENTEMLVLQGTLFYFLKQPREAKLVLEQALAHDSNLVEANYILSVIHLAEEDYDAAVRQSTNALRINPNLAKAHLNRGLAYIKKGYVDLALQDLDQAVILDDRLSVAYLYRGLVRNMTGKWQSAVADFERAHLLGHRVDLLWLSWGNALLHLEKIDEAISKLTMAIQGKTEVPSALAKRAAIYIGKGKGFYNQAEADLLAAEKIDDQLPEVYGNLGLLERAKGDNKQAVEYYLKALKLDSKLYEARYNLAKTYRLMDQLEDAKREFERVLADAPAKGADTIRRDVHRDLGLIAFEMDDLAAARQEFQQVLESVTDGAQDSLGRAVHRDLGFIAYHLSEYETAADHFNQVLSSAADDHEARYYLGLAYFRLGELNKAKTEFQRIVDSSDPDPDESLCVDANQNLGLIAMGSNNKPLAETYFLAALDIDSNNASVRYNLGLNYWNLGNLAAAEKEFATIVKNGPAGGELVKEAQRNLVELKKPVKPKAAQDEPISEKPEDRALEAK